MIKYIFYMLMVLLLVSSSFAAVDIRTLLPSNENVACTSSSQCLSGVCSVLSNSCLAVTDQWYGVGGNEYRLNSVSRSYSGMYNLTNASNITTNEFSSIVQGSDYIQPKVVDMDNDGRNELLVVSGSVITMYRYTGQALVVVATESLNASPTRDGYVDRLITSEPAGRSQFIIGSGTQYLIYGFDGSDIYLIKQTTSSVLSPQVSDILCTTDIYANMYNYCAWIEGADGIRIWETNNNPTFGTYNLSVARGAALTLGIQEPNERKLYFIDPDNNGNLRLYIPNFQRRVIYSMFVTTNTTDNAFGTAGALTFALSFWTSDTATEIQSDVPNTRHNYQYLVSRLFTTATNGQYFCGNFHHYRTAGDNKQYGVVNCVNKLGVSIQSYNFQIDTGPRNEHPFAFVQVEGFNETSFPNNFDTRPNYPTLCSLFPFANNIYMTCYKASNGSTFDLVVQQQLLGVNSNRGAIPSTLSAGVALHTNRADNYPSIWYRDSIYRINNILGASNVTVHNAVFPTNHSTYGYVFGNIVGGDSVEYIAYKNNSLLVGRALFENVSVNAPYIDTNISGNVTFGGVYGYNTNLCVGGTQNFTMRECGSGQSSNCSYVNTIGFTERLIIQSGNTIGVFHNNTPVVSRTYTAIGSYTERIILQSFDSQNTYTEFADVSFTVSATNCSLPFFDITQPPTGALPTTPPTVTPPSSGGSTCAQTYLVFYCLDDVTLGTRVGFAVLITIILNVLVTIAVMHFGQSPSPMLYGWVSMLTFISFIGSGLLPLYFGGVAILLIVGTIALFALASPRN